MVGLVAGWARSRYPVFGAIPEPAQRLLMDIGLIVFIAVVGMHAGPHAVEAYRTQRRRRSSPASSLAGMIVTVVPLAVGTIVARYVLKMSPLMTLGGLAGAQTCTPGLNALREASGSNVGSLAYTVPYAIGNILLTVWGPVVVAIVHAMRERHEARLRRPPRQDAQPVDRLRAEGPGSSRPARAAAAPRGDAAADGGAGDGEPRAAARATSIATCCSRRCRSETSGCSTRR